MIPEKRNPLILLEKYVDTDCDYVLRQVNQKKREVCRKTWATVIIFVMLILVFFYERSDFTGRLVRPSVSLSYIADSSLSARTTCFWKSKDKDDSFSAFLHRCRYRKHRLDFVRNGVWTTCCRWRGGSTPTSPQTHQTLTWCSTLTMSGRHVMGHIKSLCHIC